MSEEKERKGVKKKNVIDTSCESSINTVVKNISHQKIPRHSGIVVRNLQ